MKPVLISLILLVVTWLTLLTPGQISAQETPEDLMTQAATTYAERGQTKEGLEVVQALLDRIVAEHPSSDMSVSILLQDTVDGFNLAEFQERIQLARAGLLPVRKTSIEPGMEETSQFGEENITKDDKVAVDETAASSQSDAEVCLAETFSAVGSDKITVQVPLMNNGSIGGLPELVSPLDPSNSERVAFFGIASALEACAPYGGGLPVLQVRINGGKLLIQQAQNALKEDVEIKNEAEIVSASGPSDIQTKAFETAPQEKSSDQLVLGVSSEDSEKALDLQKQDFRDIQARLTVMEFDPKGIDGVLGKGTRSAWRDWQTTQGISVTGYVNASQLALLRQQSQEALDVWLKIPENEALYNPPPPIKIGPSNLQGRWQFTTSCGSRSRLGKVKVTGAMRIAHNGGNRYSGPLQQSQGFRGKFSGTISGRSLQGVVNWGLFLGKVSIKGRVADHKLVIRGNDSNRCSFYAYKG